MTLPCPQGARLVAGDLLLPRDGPVPVFVSHVLLCNVRFVAARVRLVNLIRAGWLTPVSVAAWARGLAALPGFWMPRDNSQAPALAQVRLLAPAAGTGIVTLPLRWETAGPVRVLNAGLTLMLVGPVQTVLRLDGVIRLPPTAAGHIRSRGVLAHRAAAACAGLLLADVADALASPAPANPGEEGRAADHGGRQEFTMAQPSLPPDHDQESPPRSSDPPMDTSAVAG